MEAPADFRRFLCGHAAMLVEFNRVVHHHRLPFNEMAAATWCSRTPSSSAMRRLIGFIDPEQ
jgi:hypothetical protein